ncbi:hypothetical protein RND71_012394 [Anisodus tanguticus]|uniref:Protein EARLY FLOWERING 4 domain-containing protein n=1 Tax=Anisodus tanguticus TaxID=243964 RepID=A0AAE1VGX2_9SOLA|nr:hypothetical protein RND71_012394 [Anisodus tanguticus]
MEGDTFSGLGNGSTHIDGKVVQTFQKSFVQVQNILDQNRLLINEINQNHESKIPDNLSRNVGLIRELNNNIRRVVDLYADLLVLSPNQLMLHLKETLVEELVTRGASLFRRTKKLSSFLDSLSWWKQENPQILSEVVEEEDDKLMIR